MPHQLEIAHYEQWMSHILWNNLFQWVLHTCQLLLNVDQLTIKADPLLNYNKQI